MRSFNRIGFPTREGFLEQPKKAGGSSTARTVSEMEKEAIRLSWKRGPARGSNATRKHSASVLARPTIIKGSPESKTVVDMIPRETGWDDHAGAAAPSQAGSHRIIESLLVMSDAPAAILLAADSALVRLRSVC